MQNDNEDIDIIGLILELWKSKLFIVLFSLISLILFFLLTYLIQPKYSSTATLMINSSGAESVLSNSLNQYSGLASIAGINLPSSGNEKMTYAYELLKSKGIYKNFIENNQIREKIAAADYYDQKKQQIIFNKQKYDENKNLWVREIPSGRNLVPSYIEIYDEFLENDLKIQQDVKTNVISITYTHISPVFAKFFIESLVSEVNKISRLKDLDKSNSTIFFLNEELAKNNKISIIDSLNRLIESNMSIKALATVEKDYLLKTIDAPFVSEERVSPNSTLFGLIGFFLGFIFSCFFVLLKNYLKKYKHEKDIP